MLIAYTRDCSRNRWVETDWKTLFILGRIRKCQRKWNSIYGRKRNENKHSFSASPSQPYNAPPIPRPVSFFFCRWSLLTGFHFPHVLYDTLCHFSRWHFNPWTVAFLIYCYGAKAVFFHKLFTVLNWRLCGLTNSPIVKYPLNWRWWGSAKRLPNG